MLIRLLLLIAATLLAAGSHAAQLKLDALKIGSKTYTNIVVLGANTTDLFFTHEEGIKSVKLKYLEPALQKRFHFNPAAALEAERRQNEEDALYQNSLATTLAARAQKAARAAKMAAISTEDSLADPISDSSPLGKKGPAIVVEKWLSDKPVTEGKFILIHFWAPWSIPSRKSIADMNALSKKFADKLAVVAIASESEADVNASDAKIDYSSAIDSKGRMSAAAGITSLPSSLLMNPKGIIIFIGHPAALNEKKLQTLFAKWGD